MKIFGAKRTNSPAGGLYTTSEDFCRVFQDDMDHLYLLSLLLTADPELAEKCFVRGLEDSKSGNPVFKEWAQSWARRTVIINSIRTIGPRPGNPGLASRKSAEQSSESLPEGLAAVVNLPAFERFVFVMSVLEGYSPRDCRLLLNCSSFDVAQARNRALQQLGLSAEATGRVVSISKSTADSADGGSGVPQRLMAHLPASA